MPKSKTMPWPLPWEFVARFWAKVDVRGPDACWEWTAARAPDGYGRVKHADQEIRAGRIAWALANGAAPPAGSLVCHYCDNPPCCNPTHLYVGTYADNSADMVRAGRSTRGYVRSPEQVQRGEAHAGAVLTEGDVREIRTLSSAGVPTTALAARFGVTASNIGCVVRRASWKHVL